MLRAGLTAAMYLYTFLTTHQRDLIECTGSCNGRGLGVCP